MQKPASVEFRDFMLSDLLAIKVQPRHQDVLDRTMGSVYTMASMSMYTKAFTMLVDGEVAACCGVTAGELWAFLGRDLRKTMLTLTRHGMDEIRKFGPVRAWVDDANPNAVRWARLAGFRSESHGYWNYP